MPPIEFSWELDGWIIVAGVLCAVAAALPGCFLVLRRMSLLGDAISHAVLPGLVAAWMISGSRNSLPMFLGAVLVGILTALLTEWVRGAGKVDEGASMGVVFTSLFALGLVMIVHAPDLDPDCVLYGAVELTPSVRVSILGMDIPRAVAVLAPVCLFNALFVLLLFKELRLSSFDPALSTSTGFSARLLHYLLMVVVALTAVASFEVAGNILVVAMFIVPPAAASLLTDRLSSMVMLSVLLAALSAVAGHFGAVLVPRWFGYGSTTTAGMMAVMAGVVFALAMLFAPRHGVVVKAFRRRLLEWKILADDVLASLYRREEQGSPSPMSRRELARSLLASALSLGGVLWWLERRQMLVAGDGGVALTESGRGEAQKLVRSHRLWEQYLVSHAGLDSDQIHNKAERLEHFTDITLREKLNEATQSATVDPHGAPIPPESPATVAE
jgi:manganese/zinc/iron transport system permease protein